MHHSRVRRQPCTPAVGYTVGWAVDRRGERVVTLALHVDGSKPVALAADRAEAVRLLGKLGQQIDELWPEGGGS